MKVKSNSTITNKKKNALSTKLTSNLLKPKTLKRNFKTSQNKKKCDVQKDKLQLVLDSSSLSSHVKQTKFKPSKRESNLSVKRPHSPKKLISPRIFTPIKNTQCSEENLGLIHHENPEHDEPTHLIGLLGDKPKQIHTNKVTATSKLRKHAITQQESNKLKNKLQTNKALPKAKKGKKQKKNQPEEKLSSIKSPVQLSKVSAAVSGLMKLVQEKSAKKTELLDLPEPIFMQVECIKIPICPTKQLRFKLPHPLITEVSDILLITADKKGSKIHPEKAVEHYTELLDKHKIHFILKVMPLRMVKRDYSQYEMQRKLVDQFDLILADANIIRSLPSALGKFICYNHKMPIPVHLDRRDLKAHFHIAMSKTQMAVKSKGHLSSVRVGHSKMSTEEIAANIVEVCNGLEELYPGGWKNIRSLNIRTPNTITLPLYLSLLSPNMLRIPVEEKKKEPDVEGELSTQPGMKVVVRADGTVFTQKIEEEKEEQAEDSIDDEILKEAEKYMQSSKTVRYDSEEENSDKEADAVTAAVEREFLSGYIKNVKEKKSGEDDEEEEEEEEEESSEEGESFLPLNGKKRKREASKSKKDGKLPEKKQKKEHQQQKLKTKGQKISHGRQPGNKGESEKRGSRGGKKNKLNKDQRKAMIKRKKAGKK